MEIDNLTERKKIVSIRSCNTNPCMYLNEGLIPTKDHPTKDAQHPQNVVKYIKIK